MKLRYAIGLVMLLATAGGAQTKTLVMARHVNPGFLDKNASEASRAANLRDYKLKGLYRGEGSGRDRPRLRGRGYNEAGYQSSAVR